MRTKKAFELALNILVHSKLRSWLTIVGIVIGIASVISIVSISQGAQASLEEQLSGLGGDLVTISPGFSQAKGFSMGGPGREGGQSTEEQENLTKKDVLAIEGVANIKYVMGSVSGKATVKYNGESMETNVEGVDTEVWKEITTEEISKGRFLNKGDSYSVVIGERLAEQSFDDIGLNRQIQIEGKSFKVVGIVEDSNSIYIPIEYARNLLEGVGNEEFDSITIKLENSDDETLYDETLDAIEKKLMFSRGILKESDKDFTVNDMKSMQETMSETMDSMALFLGAIAAISLLVGAIGIANTMFTSVLEKTKEIGIMKAIGAKNKDILSIFLINSGMIGLVGGFGGAVLGAFASMMINGMSSGTGMGMSRMFSSSYISVELVLIMLFFSSLIGMIAGAIPAYNASRMKPVDALRYE